MRKVLFVVLLVAVLVFANVGVALAHFVEVSTPSGQTLCQFLGGPGNPTHVGHIFGHPQAITHEGSDAVDIVGSC
jgi:hypothetical protein